MTISYEVIHMLNTNKIILQTETRDGSSESLYNSKVEAVGDGSPESFHTSNFETKV
jgi:hypothetical protein